MAVIVGLIAFAVRAGTVVGIDAAVAQSGKGRRLVELAGLAYWTQVPGRSRPSRRYDPPPMVVEGQGLDVMQAALRYGEELAAEPLQITMTRTQQMFGLWLVGLHAALLRVASGLTTRSACGPRPRSWPSCSSASRLRGTSRPGAFLPRQRDSATRTGRHHAARHQPSGGYETPEPAEDIRSKPAANSARRAHPVRRKRLPPRHRRRAGAGTTGVVAPAGVGDRHRRRAANPGRRQRKGRSRQSTR